MNAKHLFFAALVVLACGPGPEILPCGSPHVVATLSSVTLANDCSGSAAGVADAAQGACLTGTNCYSLCRQSSMQLSFGSSATTAARVEIRAVRLLEPKTLKLLQTLTSREPRQWSAEKYIAWDELVPAGGGLKASYKLSAPGYHSASDARYTLQNFVVEVDVAIDGEVRTLQAEATREPEVAT
jgi:hypothetical protein